MVMTYVEIFLSFSIGWFLGIPVCLLFNFYAFFDYCM